MATALNPDKALIFRIVHRDNVGWILDHGMHCRNSNQSDPNYVNIGNADLISKRHHRVIPIPPGGTLSDYVPFYFTPYSPMLYNIRTGWGGIRKRDNEEIVFLVSSLYKLRDSGIDFLFTDRHAYLQAAEFHSDLAQLQAVPWTLLQSRDFSKDPNDPEKVERYQAEALIHKTLPVGGLLGVVCYSKQTDSKMKALLGQRGLDLRTDVRPGWYFP